MNSKVDELDVHKLVSVSINLSKLSYSVKNDLVKKDADKAKIWYYWPDITNLATKASLNAKTIEIKRGIPSITTECSYCCWR